jgi:MFS family permease
MVRVTEATRTTAAPSLWRNGAFLRLWTGETFSWFGESVGNFVIPIIAISVLGATELEVGLLNAFSTLAFLVIGLPAGAWVDRWLKRATMLRADLARGLIVLALPILWLTGVLQFWHLLIGATLVGALSVFFDVAYQSYVPLIVAKEQIAPANGRLETSAQVARIAGPALGGGLLAVLSAPIVLFGTAATYLLSFVALTTIRDSEVAKPKSDRRPLRIEIKEGLVWVFRQPLLVRIVLCTGISNLFGTIALTMLPVLVLRELAIPEWVFGIMGTAGSAGGLLGALSAAWLTKRIGEGTVIPVSAVVYSVVGFLMPLAIAIPAAAVPILIVMEVLFGYSVVVYNIAQVSFRQRICPPELLGRMNASVRFIVWGVMPVGGLLSGLFATWLGLDWAIWIGVVGGLLGCAPVVFSRLLGMRTLPDIAEARAE